MSEDDECCEPVEVHETLAVPRVESEAVVLPAPPAALAAAQMASEPHVPPAQPAASPVAEPPAQPAAPAVPPVDEPALKPESPIRIESEGEDDKGKVKGTFKDTARAL